MTEALAVVPSPPKSWIQKLVAGASPAAPAAPSHSAMSYVKEAGGLFGRFVQAGGVGAVLGAAHAKVGLDTKVGPIDGLLAGLGFLLGVGLSGSNPWLAQRLADGGTQAMTVLSFRKAYDLMGGSSSSFHGEPNQIPAPRVGGYSPAAARFTGEDPIITAAKRASL